jgi:outer membrane murein-binding lipoprotein Lpp
MNYVLPILLVIGLAGLLVLSGCVSEKKDTNDDQLTAGIDNANNQNNALDSADKQISDDLGQLNTDDKIITDDPEIQAIDSDLSELDALLQDENPMAGLN